MSELNTAQMNLALAELRCLQPRERLRVIAQVLMELDRDWDEMMTTSHTIHAADDATTTEELTNDNPNQFP
jgi:hypothetical protein